MKLRRTYAAFTLIELLTVIGIIGLLAAVVGPVLTSFRKGDAMLAATRTMLDGVGRARQLAISQHTTVYMVFVPPNFWDNTLPLYQDLTAYNKLPASELIKATNVLDKQLSGFTFVSLRSIGDQPGRNTPHYLAAWQSLPDKAFIAPWKFNLGVNNTLFITDNASGQVFPVRGFNVTNTIPFPSDDVPYLGIAGVPPYVNLPYIAFDYQGRLVSGDGTPLGRDEYIPLAHGSVSLAINPATRKAQATGITIVQEQKPGNSTNTAYNLIHIDWLTGRARLEHQQVK
jgi:prepilin-type N-terminal cleavage/methylation domain-containing protein